jgi:N4-gp56 family major capsid protein
MADVFTQSVSPSNAAAYVEAALDLQTRMYLQTQPMFRQFADSKILSPDHQGVSYTVTVNGERPPAITPLAETVDVSASDIPAPRTVTITLAEYGDALIHTARLSEVTWDSSLIKNITWQLGDSMATSIDLLVRAELDNATNLLTPDAGTGGAGPTLGGTVGSALMGASITSAAVGLLRSRRAIPHIGQDYVAMIHPHVARDVRAEAGPGTWLQPHENAANETGPIYEGVTGRYAGAAFVENVRCTTTGTGATTKYTSYFLGHDALLEAVAIEPHSVVGPVVDKLKRLQPIGWYGFLGWKVYRQNCIQRVTTSSSLAGVTGNGVVFDSKA